MARYSPLFSRDVCSDAFGSNAANAICNPSNTLCCVRYGQQYPACLQYLGKGWCCVGSQDSDNCYVDTPSACDEANSVPCSQLGPGVSKSCCPRLTTCASGYDATEANVRCNIQYGDLQRLAFSATTSSSTTSATTTTSSTSSTTSSISTSQTTTSTSTTSNTSTPQSSSGSSIIPTPQASSGLSGGVLAGVIIGPVLAFILAVILAYVLLRRHRRHRDYDQGPLRQSAEMPHEKASNAHFVNNPTQLYGHNTKSELSTNRPPTELSGVPNDRHNGRYELSSYGER